MPNPQWFAGMTLTADRLNASRMKMVVQTENQEVASSITPVPSEIVIPLEAGATYWYQAVITYSAFNTVTNGGGGFRWMWDVPTGTAMPRQVATMALGAMASQNDGHPVILRSPAASTEIRAEGTDGENGSFLSVHEYGSIQVGGASGDATLQWAQWASHATPTILRGILRTRVYYQRVL